MKTATLALLAALGAAFAWLMLRAQQADGFTVYEMAGDGGELAPEDTAPTDDTTQLPTAAETAWLYMASPWAAFGSGAAATDTEAANIRAGLDLIAYAEGTAGYPGGGYATMFGGRQCLSLADHPRQRWTFTNGRGQQLTTSAAGRYQFLSRTWDELARKLGLQDFGPASQDAACIELIRQRGALDDLKAGRVPEFVSKCAKTWASLPGAGYAQPERKLSQLVNAYTQAGGTLAA